MSQVESEVLNPVLNGNAQFGTFMLIHVNNSKWPFKVESNMWGFNDSEYDNTQLTIYNSVSIQVSNIISVSNWQTMMKPMHEKSKTIFFGRQGPGSALS
jgi:hypothetical protein